MRRRPSLIGEVAEFTAVDGTATAGVVEGMVVVGVTGAGAAAALLRRA
jgi:hypothetical protein